MKNHRGMKFNSLYSIFKIYLNALHGLHKCNKSCKKTAFEVFRYHLGYMCKLIHSSQKNTFKIKQKEAKGKFELLKFLFVLLGFTLIESYLMGYLETNILPQSFLIEIFAA